jgi:hypothetical protein
MSIFQKTISEADLVVILIVSVLIVPGGNHSNRRHRAILFRIADFAKLCFDRKERSLKC